jgi:hypothetical protein
MKYATIVAKGGRAANVNIAARSSPELQNAKTSDGMVTMALSQSSGLSALLVVIRAAADWSDPRSKLRIEAILPRAAGRLS